VPSAAVTIILAFFSVPYGCNPSIGTRIMLICLRTPYEGKCSLASPYSNRPRISSSSYPANAASTVCLPARAESTICQPTIGPIYFNLLCKPGISISCLCDQDGGSQYKVTPIRFLNLYAAFV
jgi:hypothetical protein